MSRIELIAEIATNHGGNMPLAKEFIDRFAEAGATFIKFQYTRVKHLRPEDPQFAWFKQAELSDDQFAELKAHTEAAGAKFLLTCFNGMDVPSLVKLGCEAIKIGSGEASDVHLLSVAIATQLRVIRSIHWTHENQRPLAWDDIVLNSIHTMACAARYPASRASSLAAIRRMEGDRLAGYSDHSIGTEMATWAMECGARIIEKHVCLDHQARPPRPFEATVSEFKYLRTFADDDPDLKFRGRWQFA